VKRTFLWWLVNGLAAVMLYVGYFRNIEGARNVFLFLTWFNFALCVCVAFAADVQKSIRNKGRSVPAWISVTYDVAMVTVMVWIGLWWTASAYTFSALINNGIYMKDDEARAAT
jgi:hypothetical protein